MSELGTIYCMLVIVCIGSTVDAMSEAIEGADVVCYGVSQACECYGLLP